MSEPNPNHTALDCLVVVGRHHGLDLSPERLRHDHALAGAPSIAELVKIARESGFKAKAAKLDWKDLGAVGAAFPLLAPLDNGNWVALAGYRPQTEDVALFDPLAEGSPGLIFVDRESFAARWTGDVVFLKRSYALGDPDQPFGLRWFWPEIARQKKLFADIAVAALALHLLSLALPIFIQLVIDKVLLHQSQTTLQVLTIGICAALLFDAGFNFLRRYLLLYASNRIDIRVATRTFAHLLALPIGFFERASAGVLVKHMQQAEKIRQFLTGRLFLTLLDATALVVMVPALLMYSGTLTLVVLGFTAVIAAIIGALMKPFQTRLQALYQAEGQRQALLVESIHGMPTIKSLALEPRQRQEWDRRAANAIETNFRVGKISATAQALTVLLEKLMLVAVIAVGASLVFDNAITMGALIAFQMIASRVSGPLVQLVSLVHEFQEAALSVRMLGHVMNQRPERGDGARGIRPPLAGHVALQGVTFRYPGQSAPALDHVSVDIPDGTIFGIVGRSGSGKTTVTRLVQGLYPVQEGMVRIDGHDVREIDLVHLRSSIGVVLQENFMFRGTVRENIAAARPDSTLEEVIEAARMAGADEFVERLPQGYDTELEENATNLSGGQKQRLAIARALLARPRILIFDEATSALDPESEAIVRRNLHRIAAGRTLIIVTHRLSSLVDADRILVLGTGRVEAVGPHRELLETSPTYKLLWDQQTGYAA